MYQVVTDTNVLVAGLLSNLGASHRWLRLVGDEGWRVNLSAPLFLEYEQTLKRVCTRGSLSSSDIDEVLRFLGANASLRLIFFLWRPLLPDPKDDFAISRRPYDILPPQEQPMKYLRGRDAYLRAKGLLT
jgi:predicted nucleic acid-binding protein